LLVEPDDADSLADGLFELWSNREHRARLATRAFDGVRAQHALSDSAGRLAEVYRDVISAGLAVQAR
jgi:glycosyltransferase involved in cell wall biosynthesis